MARHKDAGSSIPGDVTAFIGSVDKIEIDDGFAKDTKAVDAAKKLFVFKTLVSFDLPPAAEDVERANAIRLYEKTHPPGNAASRSNSPGDLRDPSDYTENMKYQGDRGQGRPAQLGLSQTWINGQADCVDDGKPKPGVWVHTHADGTIRDFRRTPTRCRPPSRARNWPPPYDSRREDADGALPRPRRPRRQRSCMSTTTPREGFHASRTPST
jgi:hypothetical protein